MPTEGGVDFGDRPTDRTGWVELAEVMADETNTVPVPAGETGNHPVELRLSCSPLKCTVISGIIIHPEIWPPWPSGYFVEGKHDLESDIDWGDNILLVPLLGIEHGRLEGGKLYGIIVTPSTR